MHKNIHALLFLIISCYMTHISTSFPPCERTWEQPIKNTAMFNKYSAHTLENGTIIVKKQTYEQDKHLRPTFPTYVEYFIVAKSIKISNPSFSKNWSNHAYREVYTNLEEAQDVAAQKKYA